MTESVTPYSEAAIFGRMIEVDKDDLSPELAQHILSLSISHEDQQRINSLLEQAQAGTLSEQQQEELDNLNHIADLLSLWHSKRTGL